MAKDYPTVITYRYDGSPFAAKIDHVLAMKGIPHYECDVSMTLPRPQITDFLGIGYRRIPILAIGNDVFCDTSLITSQLEAQFPADAGFTTIFPPRKDGGKVDAGIIKTLAMTYGDRTIFPLAGSSLPYNKFDSKMIEDRGKWSGAPLDVDGIISKQPSVKSTLASHMSLLEEQLSDGREWLFDTIQPGFGDLSVHFVWSWVIIFRGMKDVLSADKFPNSISWINRVSAYIKTKRSQFASSVKKINGEEAAKIISQAHTPNPVPLPFDHDEAQRLDVHHGDQVSIIPDDNAKNYPTIGKLIGLDRERFVLEVQGSAVKSLRCHFPRLNFRIRRVSSTPSKL